MSQIRVFWYQNNGEWGLWLWESMTDYALWTLGFLAHKRAGSFLFLSRGSKWLLLCVSGYCCAWEREHFSMIFILSATTRKYIFNFQNTHHIYFIMKIAKCQVLGVSLKGGETKFFSKQKICLSSICQAVIHVLIEIIVSVIGWNSVKPCFRYKIFGRHVSNASCLTDHHDELFRLPDHLLRLPHCLANPGGTRDQGFFFVKNLTFDKLKRDALPD